jgi:hypothetical protein
MEVGDQVIYYNGKLSSWITPNSDKLTNINEIIMGVTSRANGNIGDRTGTFSGRYKLITPAIPSIPNNFSKSFEDICNERAVQLVNTGKTLLVTWSGGIDSTCVLISLLKAVNDTSQIKVLFEGRAIEENPTFYNNHIKDNLAHEVLDNYWVYSCTPGPNELLITGDNIGQIFGMSATSFMENRNDSWIPHIKSKMAPQRFEFFMEKTIPQFAKCPFEIQTIFDLYWWISFSLRWTHSQTRILRYNTTYTKEMYERIVSFYGTDDFQIWSLLNHDKKIKDTAETYKYVMKDIIFDYDGNQDYYDGMTSRPSAGPKSTQDGTINDYETIKNRISNSELPVLIDSNYNYFYKNDIQNDPEAFKKLLQPFDTGEWMYGTSRV